MDGVIAKNVYGKYHVPGDLSHRPAVKRVLSGKVYEPETIAFMRAHAGEGDIVHAGTFFGDFLPGLSKNMANGARIWAFEPNPRSYQHARETIKLNGLMNVTLTHAAVSEASGTVQLRTHSSGGEALGGLSHVRSGIEGDPGFVSVDSIRLDDAVPDDRHVSIIQLDVEGHELSAVLGAGAILHRCKPILILEAFERNRWIRRQFGSLGYEHLGAIHGNHIYAVPEAAVDLGLRA